MAGFLGACALPMSSTPTQFVFPTPNLTMTALFQIPPTATTGVGIISPDNDLTFLHELTPKRASRARIIMLAPVMDVLAKADEEDSDPIEARLDKTGSRELRHECAVEAGGAATKA